MNVESIRLQVPAKHEYLVTVRLVASSVAGRAGFDMDNVEDIKTACSEACLLLMPYIPENGELAVSLTIEREGLRAVISAPRDEALGSTTLESEFSAFMLEALTDEANFSAADGEGEYCLFKAFAPVA